MNFFLNIYQSLSSAIYEVNIAGEQHGEDIGCDVKMGVCARKEVVSQGEL